MRGAPPLLDGGRRVKHPPLAQTKKDQLREAGLLDVCFRWAQGRCDAAGCRFSHRPLRQWEIELFGQLLDGKDAQPEASQPDDQALASAEQDADIHDYPQQDTVREGHQWDVTVPLFQPAPLILEPSSQNKRRLSAPRPSSSLRKGVKVYMPGSTILRRKLGDHSSTRIIPLSTQQTSRSALAQPCVFASPPGQPENCLQHQGTWCYLKVSRSRVSGTLKSEITPGKGSLFPLSSYVSNPPGTRPKPATARPDRNVISPVKDGSWKPSVFKRAWADMSDSSEEELLTSEMPPPPEATSNSGRHTLTGLSKRAYKRLRQYAFWKVRKGYRQQRPKDPNPCSKSAFDLPSVGPSNHSLSLLSFVNESAHLDSINTEEGQRPPGHVADNGPQGQAWGEPENKAAVSRCKAWDTPFPRSRSLPALRRASPLALAQ